MATETPDSKQIKVQSIAMAMNQEVVQDNTRGHPYIGV